VQGSFSNVSIDYGSSEDECKKVTDAKPEYSPTKLSIVFTVEDKDSAECRTDSPGPVANDNIIAIAAGVSVGGVVLGALVIVILSATVPALKHKIQPFSAREPQNKHSL